MSKEKTKKETNSEEAPPCTPGIIKELFTICPECSSAIEISSINDINNIIEYRCLKDNKKYIMPIKQYLDELKKNNKKNFRWIKKK